MFLKRKQRNFHYLIAFAVRYQDGGHEYGNHEIWSSGGFEGDIIPGISSTRELRDKIDAWVSENQEREISGVVILNIVKLEK